MDTSTWNQHCSTWKLFCVRLQKLSPTSFSIPKAWGPFIGGISLIIVSVTLGFLSYNFVQISILQNLEAQIDIQNIKAIIQNFSLIPLDLQNQSRAFRTLPEKSSKAVHFWWNETDPTLVVLSVQSEPFFIGNTHRIKNYVIPNNFKWIYLGHGFDGLGVALLKLRAIRPVLVQPKSRQNIDKRAILF